jgi:transposase
MQQASRVVTWHRVLADAAFDSEENHRLCREDLHVRSTAIPINRRNQGRKWPKTHYRRPMKQRFPKRKYGQRWQAESAFARHKRRLDSALRGRSDASRERECYLRVLTHDLMLLAASR